MYVWIVCISVRYSVFEDITNEGRVVPSAHPLAYLIEEFRVNTLYDCYVFEYRSFFVLSEYGFVFAIRHRIDTILCWLDCLSVRMSIK